VEPRLAHRCRDHHRVLRRPVARAARRG
jgi:hypothetical protein